MTHVVMTINRSNTFLLDNQKLVQLVAPAIRIMISVANINVKPVSASSTDIMLLYRYTFLYVHGQVLEYAFTY
jgi:hypothetical protein